MTIRHSNKIVKLAVVNLYNYKFEICCNIEGFKILGLGKFIYQEEKIDRKENLTNNWVPKSENSLWPLPRTRVDLSNHFI